MKERTHSKQSHNYKSSKGEPYVLEYQRNIETQMKNARGFTNLRYEVLIPGHVNMWLLERKASA